MKNKKIRHAIEWGILILLVLLYVKLLFFSYGSLDALSAHEQSERTYHYGPSEIKEVISIDSAKVYLGLYQDRWFSANIVKRQGLRWVPGSGVGGHPIDENQKLTYSWGISRIEDNLYLVRWFGYVSDPSIQTVELAVRENQSDAVSTYPHANPSRNKILRKGVGEDRMFLFVWNQEKDDYHWEYLRGLDKNGEVVYEKEFR